MTSRKVTSRGLNLTSRELDLTWNKNDLFHLTLNCKSANSKKILKLQNSSCLGFSEFFLCSIWPCMGQISNSVKLSFSPQDRQIPNFLSKQDCIPGGCVPPACCPYLPACTVLGGCLLLGGTCLWSRGGYLPLVREGGACLWSEGCIPACNGADPPLSTEWQTRVKT